MDLFFQEEMPAGWDKNAVRTCWVFLLLFLTRARQISQENLPSCPALLPNPEASSDFFFFFQARNVQGEGNSTKKTQITFPVSSIWKSVGMQNPSCDSWYISDGIFASDATDLGKKNIKTTPKTKTKTKNPPQKLTLKIPNKSSYFPHFQGIWALQLLLKTGILKITEIL